MGEKAKKDSKTAAKKDKAKKEEKRQRAAARQNIVTAFSKGEKRVLNPKRTKAKNHNKKKRG